MVFAPGLGWSNLGLATLIPSGEAYIRKVLTKVYFTYIKLVYIYIYIYIDLLDLLQKKILRLHVDYCKKKYYSYM